MSLLRIVSVIVAGVLLLAVLVMVPSPGARKHEEDLETLRKEVVRLTHAAASSSSSGVVTVAVVATTPPSSLEAVESEVKPSLETPLVVAAQEKVVVVAADAQFDIALARYAARQGNFTSAIIYQCDSHDLCGGLGDRWKGAMMAATLGILTNRAIIIDTNKGYRLETFYEPNLIEWRVEKLKSIFSRKEKLVRSFIDQGCPAIESSLANLRFPGNIIIKVNTDCLSLIIRLPRYIETARELGMFAQGNWQSKLFKALFKPTHTLEAGIQKALATSSHAGFGGLSTTPATIPNPEKLELFGIHVRVGGPELNDPVRLEKAQLGSVVDMYVRCFEYVRAQFHSAPPSEKATVVVAADNEQAILGIVAKLEEKNHVVTSASVGNLGHVERLRTEGSDLRMFVDFELLRRSKYFLLGNSGFSAMAYTFRDDQSAVVFSNFDNPKYTCRWAFSHFGILGN